MTRSRVVFRSAFRGERALCIVHVSVNGKKTLCGLRVEEAEEVVVDAEAKPDCLSCARKAFGL